MQQVISSGRYRLRTLLVLCLCAGLGGLAPVALAAPACGDLQVDNAWVRVVPGAPVAAGYFELHNPGASTITVTAVASPQFGRVQMHESMTDDKGMATMQPVDSVTLAGGQSLAFAPGGYHLMLFNAQQSLQPGDEVTLQLQCDDADARRTVTAVVRDSMPADAGDMAMPHAQHGDMQHMHHDD